MPPIQQQQTSRAGLITSLVFAILIAIGGIVGWVMTNADLTKAEVALTNEKSKYKNVITPDKVNETSIATLKAEFSPSPTALRQGTVIEAGALQRQALMKQITDSPVGSEQGVLDLVENTYTRLRANPDLVEKPKAEGEAVKPYPTPSLTAVIDALSARVSAEAAARRTSDALAKQKTEELAAAQKAFTVDVAALNTKVTEVQAAMAQLDTDTKKTIEANEAKVKDFETRADAAEKSAAARVAEYEVRLQTATQATAKVQKLYDVSNNLLAQFRPDVKESIVRNVDATITQLAPDNICYINLGYGDHVVVGMTFEVYPKLDGVPRLNPGQNPLDMTKGVASIEIISIGQNSCQCRILRTNTGVVLSQGDLCVNVVYDRNIKPSFFVYGKFDMDGNGVATDQEAEIIKSLITRWGGKVAEKVGIETDFLVMGKEPVVPIFTPEEKTQPLIKAKEDEAKAALAAYDAIRLDAVGLHIPVLNQNRFLYYTGYFDTAKK